MIDKEKLTKDYLPETDIYLYQAKDMFRVNTDTHLLGRFLYVNENETILDIGVNNGALLLYANQYHPLKMIGIDIQEEACEIARLNMEYNKIFNAEIICGDITQLKIEPVDVIVCNPPYFIDDKNEKNEKVNIARNEVYLPLEQLFPCISRLLKQKGRCYMVHRVNRLNELYRELIANNLNIKQMSFIFDENHNYAHGILLEIVKGNKVHLRVNTPVWVK